MSSEVNNAKMREACEMFVKAMEYEKCIHTTMLTEAYQKAKDALSASIRNCDAIDCNWLPDEFYRSIYGRLPVSPEELDEFMEFSWLGFVKWIEAPYKEGVESGNE